MAGSIVIEIHSLESLASQIWKEAFKETRLRDFKMGRTNLPGNPKRKQDFRDIEQYPLAPSRSSNMSSSTNLFFAKQT